MTPNKDEKKENKNSLWTPVTPELWDWEQRDAEERQKEESDRIREIKNNDCGFDDPNILDDIFG